MPPLSLTLTAPESDILETALLSALFAMEGEPARDQVADLCRRHRLVKLEYLDAALGYRVAAARNIA